jgi:hypothetical protein
MSAGTEGTIAVCLPLPHCPLTACLVSERKGKALASEDTVARAKSPVRRAVTDQQGTYIVKPSYRMSMDEEDTSPTVASLASPKSPSNANKPTRDKTITGHYLGPHSSAAGSGSASATNRTPLATHFESSPSSSSAGAASASSSPIPLTSPASKKPDRTGTGYLLDGPPLSQVAQWGRDTGLSTASTSSTGSTGSSGRHQSPSTLVMHSTLSPAKREALKNTPRLTGGQRSTYSPDMYYLASA